MQKICWSIALAVCCGLLFAGCNEAQIDALERSQENMSNEIQSLRKQIKALEAAVLTINAELNSLRADHAADSRERAEAAREIVTQSEQASIMPRQLKSPRDCTRVEFEKQLIGMSAEQVEKFLGAPNKKTEMERGTAFWVYDALLCRNAEGTAESVGVQVAFENSRVDRASFSENVAYDHQPPAVQ